MTQEEKAKAYDEALKVIKECTPDENGFITIYPQEIFPELKESEDETIRKDILTAVKEAEGSLYVIMTPQKQKRWIAWLEKQNYDVDIANKEYWRGYREGKQEIFDKYAELEKQSEQKEINLVKILKHYPREAELYSPLYGKLWLAEIDEKNGIITCYKHHLEEGCTRAVLEQEDTVSFYSNGTTGLPDFNVSKDCMLFLYDTAKQGEQKSVDKIESKFNVRDWVVRGNTIAQILDVQEQYYVGLDIDGNDFTSSRFLNDDKIHLWTIQDAKDGDVLAGHETIVLFKKIEGQNIRCYCTYHFMNNPHFYVDTLQSKNPYCPAKKEQCDLLFQKIKKAGYEWDAEKKELKKIKQKPAWSITSKRPNRTLII